MRLHVRRETQITHSLHGAAPFIRSGLRWPLPAYICAQLIIINVVVSTRTWTRSRASMRMRLRMRMQTRTLAQSRTKRSPFASKRNCLWKFMITIFVSHCIFPSLSAYNLYLLYVAVGLYLFESTLWCGTQNVCNLQSFHYMRPSAATTLCHFTRFMWRENLIMIIAF